MTTMAEVAKQARLDRIEEKQTKKVILRNMRDNGIRFRTVRGTNLNKGDQFGGGVVVAFRQRPKSNLVDIALSSCHPEDQFCKIEGYYIAGKALMEGRCITLHKSQLDNFTIASEQVSYSIFS